MTISFVIYVVYGVSILLTVSGHKPLQIGPTNRLVRRDAGLVLWDRGALVLTGSHGWSVPVEGEEIGSLRGNQSGVEPHCKTLMFSNMPMFCNQS